MGSTTWLPLTKSHLATPVGEWQLCHQQRPATVAPLQGGQPASFWQDDYTGPLRGKDNVFSQWIDISSGHGFAFPAHNAFAKTSICECIVKKPYPPSWYPTQYCFWPRKPLQSQRSVTVGPWSWNPLVLPHYPLSWSRWTDKKMEWPFEDTITVLLH